MTVCDLLQGSPYQGYTYAYPHKTAYRRLPHPIPLAEAWTEEPQDALFLYLHVPFCATRCGYCNLFSLAGADRGLVRHYLNALTRQAATVREALPRARFSRLALGGGTPTLLAVDDLDALFELCRGVMGVDARAVPTSVEVSPATATPGKLALLRGHGVDRISIGVQSFNDAELRWLGRAQTAEAAQRALARIREAGFPVLNIDLIYGGPVQTTASWLASVRAAMRYAPEELYLYPLYLRPMTGLAQEAPCEDTRLAAYRAVRDLLLEEGYRQVSQRMFRHPAAPPDDGPAYCCQRDGMVGLGCGARSYTRTLHYATEYAVAPARVAAIIDAYARCTAADFAGIEHGLVLDEEEQGRRYLLKTLLLCTGTDRAEFRGAFGVDILDARPELADLAACGLAEITASHIKLTPAGIERSDAIGPWLYSPQVTRLMEQHAWT